MWRTIQETNTHTQQQQLCHPIYVLLEDQKRKRCSIFLPSHSSFHNQIFHSASHCNHLGNYSTLHHQCDYRFLHSDISNLYNFHSDSLQQSRKLIEGLTYSTYFSNRSWIIFQLTNIHTSYKISTYWTWELLTLLLEPPRTLSTIRHHSETVLSIHRVITYTTIWYLSLLLFTSL